MKEYAKLLDRDSIIEAINTLNEDDLRFLNQLIVERMKLIAQAKSTRLMADFFIGARVSFHTPDGQVKKGVIQRMHKKTASIKTDDGHIWNVYPGFLKKES